MPTFTDDWARFYQDWARWLEPYRGKPASGIEIGVYEGRSTCWLFENILTHSDARLWCLDTFESFDGIEGDYLERFEDNTGQYEDRINLDYGLSQDFLREIPITHPYDFAIIDGSHAAKDVLADSVLVWDWLKPGGIIIWDDYEWLGFGHAQCAETDKPRIAIDAFVSVYRPEILQSGYQLICRKGE